MNLFLLLAQDPVTPPITTEGLTGDPNLIWVIGGLLTLLFITNSYWVYRDRRVAAESIAERVEWEKKRDAFDDWKEKAHKKMLRLALRVQKAFLASVDEDVDD